MRKQLELFDHDWNDTSITMNHDQPLDALATIDDDIDIAMESGDNDRLVELIQMRTAYSQ
jgi:phosphorylcholine metabolism protein LicD